MPFSTSYDMMHSFRQNPPPRLKKPSHSLPPPISNVTHGECQRVHTEKRLQSEIRRERQIYSKKQCKDYFSWFQVVLLFLACILTFKSLCCARNE